MNVDPEYKDVNLIRNLQFTPERTDTLELTQKFNERFFNQTRRSMIITHLSIMMDDIRNYRPLTEEQIDKLEDLSEREKIEIIKTFNIMFTSIESIINE